MKKSFIQLHIAVFLAGFTGIFGKLITLNEGLLVWYRLLITAATMWLLFFFTKKLQRISWKDIIRLTGVGFLAALHWVTFYGAIKYSNISVGVVCISAVGFFTAVIEPIITVKRLNKVEVALGLLVIAGIYIIFRFDPKYKIGIALGITCALLVSFVMIWMRGFIQRINPETVLTYQLSGGFLLLSACMPFYLHYFPTSYIIPVAKDWVWLFILAWLCSVLAFQLTGYALKKLSAFTVNLSFNLEPVYGILFAFLFYNEGKDLNVSFFIGLAIIIISLVLHILYLKRNAASGK